MHILVGMMNFYSGLNASEDAAGKRLCRVIT